MKSLCKLTYNLQSWVCRQYFFSGILKKKKKQNWRHFTHVVYILVYYIYTLLTTILSILIKMNWQRHRLVCLIRIYIYIDLLFTVVSHIEYKTVCARVNTYRMFMTAYVKVKYWIRVRRVWDRLQVIVNRHLPSTHTQIRA